MKVLRTVRRMVDRTLGFPLILENVNIIDINGDECLDVNYGVLSEKLLISLCIMPGGLSGNHVRFIRESAGMTQEEFSHQFKVSRQIVSKWENCGDEKAKLHSSTELLIRIWCIERVSKTATQFKQYCHLIMRLEDFHQSFQLKYNLNDNELRTA